MNAPNVVPHPDTAPRDLAALAEYKTFARRRLAEQLAALGFAPWSDDKARVAFLIAPGEVAGEVLLQKLNEYDASRGVTPEAPKEAQAKPATRKPATRKPAAKSAVVSPEQLVEGFAAQTAQLVQPSAPALDEARIAEILDARMLQHGADMNQAVHLEISSLQAELAEMKKVQKAMLGILALFGQQVLGAGMADFMPSAAEDAETALAILKASEGNG